MAHNQALAMILFQMDTLWAKNLRRQFSAAPLFLVISNMDESWSISETSNESQPETNFAALKKSWLRTLNYIGASEKDIEEEREKILSFAARAIWQNDVDQLRMVAKLPGIGFLAWQILAEYAIQSKRPAALRVCLENCNHAFLKKHTKDCDLFYVAVRSGQTECVSLLMEYGCDVRGEVFRKSITIAYEEGDGEMINMLIDAARCAVQMEESGR